MSLKFPKPHSAGRGKWLTPEECIAINLFWRAGYSPTVLAKVFGVSTRTLYYRAISSISPTVYGTNTARQVNEYIDRIGEKTAWGEYVTDKMTRTVADAMRRAA
jgi:hypothetical protein